jgi:hypothetical protein
MFARYEIVFLFGALGALVAFQMITGRINIKGLLSDKTKKGAGTFSPARLQLLMFTLAFAVYILGKVMNSIAAGNPHLPEIDQNVMLILGGSQALFLGAKSLPLSGSNPDTVKRIETTKGD